MATVAGLLGRLVQTGWGDRLHPASTVRLGALVTGGGALVLAVIATEAATRLTAVGVAGTAQGAWVAALPSLVAGAVPASARGRVMGQVYAWAAAGSVSGPLMVGWLAQRVGAAPAFGLCALLCLTGALTTPREVRGVTVPARAPTRRTT
jgi:MFS family permease